MLNSEEKTKIKFKPLKSILSPWNTLIKINLYLSFLYLMVKHMGMKMNFFVQTPDICI